jgi:hypothetical protein
LLHLLAPVAALELEKELALELAQRQNRKLLHSHRKCPWHWNNNRLHCHNQLHWSTGQLSNPCRNSTLLHLLVPVAALELEKELALELALELAQHQNRKLLHSHCKCPWHWNSNHLRYHNQLRWSTDQPSNPCHSSIAHRLLVPVVPEAALWHWYQHRKLLHNRCNCQQNQNSSH